MSEHAELSVVIHRNREDWAKSLAHFDDEAFIIEVDWYIRGEGRKYKTASYRVYRRLLTQEAHRRGITL